MAQRVIAAAIIVVVAACSLAPSATPALSSATVVPGLASRDEVVTSYLDALGNRDASAIAGLVPASVDARRDIAAVLARYGGLRFATKDVTYLDEFGGVYVVAKVVGTGADDGLMHEVTVPVARVAGRYFLALGQASPSGSEASPASPSP